MTTTEDDFSKERLQRRNSLLVGTARKIRDRIETQSADEKSRTGKGWGSRKKDEANLNMWCGAIFALTEVLGEDNKDVGWLSTVLTVIIWPRGYSETLRIIDAALDKEKANAKTAA